MNAGETATFKVVATSTELTYQWYYQKSGESIWNQVSVNGTAATYSLTTVARHNGYTYRCKVTNSAGSVYSSTATLTVAAGVKITAQPKSVTVAKAGDTARTTVTATGDGLTYQWYVKDPGSSSFTKSSNTTKSYSVVLTAAKSGRQVYCVVGDKYGNTVKSNTVTLTIE